MEDDDSDAEMADYGTDDADDVDPNFDAKARTQQGSTVEIRSRRSFAGALREVPFKRLGLLLREVPPTYCGSEVGI